jgi:hypothetical protein
VAIFSTETFDATTIDFSTVTLNSASVRLRGKAQLAASCEDINQDGLLDVVIQVDREGFLDIGDAIGKLQGLTSDGICIEGTDSVRIIQ